MQSRYEFKTNLAYYEEAFDKYRRTHWFYRFARTITWIGLVVLVLCWIMVAIQRVWLPVATITAFVALILFSPFLERCFRKRKLLQSPFLNDECVLSFSEVGLESRTTKNNSQANWDVVTKAVRYSDGWLLFYGPQFYCWLNDVMLMEGSLEDVDRLIRQRVPVIVLGK
jgi:hypothetical protein